MGRGSGSWRSSAPRRGWRQARQAGATRSAGEQGLPRVPVSGAAPSHEGPRGVGYREEGPRVEEAELERESEATNSHLRAGDQGGKARRPGSSEAAERQGDPSGNCRRLGCSHLRTAREERYGCPGRGRSPVG